MTKWGWKNQITEGNLRKWKWNKAIISRRIQRRNKKRWKKDIQEIMNTGAWRGEQRDRIWQSKLRLSYRLWPGRQRQSHDGHWQLFADRCEICWMLNRPLMLFCVFICLCCFSSLTIRSISPQLPLNYLLGLQGERRVLQQDIGSIHPHYVGKKPCKYSVVTQPLSCVDVQHVYWCRNVIELVFKST